jgi:methionine-rich copper-binding protein CopC
MRTPLAIAALLIATSNAALAHAKLDHASPAVDSTVPSAPAEVVLTFTEKLEATFSTVTVTDASGARVEEGKPQVSGNTMQIGLKAAAPGAYKVHWHAVSADTHSSEGTFTFTVGGK